MTIAKSVIIRMILQQRAYNISRKTYTRKEEAKIEAIEDVKFLNSSENFFNYLALLSKPTS